jgi:[acyl-carrier-protein] S-malonyltransferase
MTANGARLYVAVYNSPQQCVVSGVRNDLNKLAIALQSRGGETAMLDIPTASHSPFMSPVTGEFLAYLQEFKFRTPVSEVISNITGLPFVVDSIVETLTAHLDHPVRWHQSIIHLKERGFKFFLDMGPQQILKNLCRRIDNSLVSYGFDCIDDSENVKTLGEQGNPAIRLLKKCLVFSVSAKNHNYDVHRYATDVLAPIADLRSIRNGLTTVCNVSGCETAVSLTRKILHGKGYSEQEVNSMTRDLETEIDAIRATR